MSLVDVVSTILLKIKYVYIFGWYPSHRDNFSLLCSLTCDSRELKLLIVPIEKEIHFRKYAYILILNIL